MNGDNPGRASQAPISGRTEERRNGLCPVHTLAQPDAVETARLGPMLCIEQSESLDPGHGHQTGEFCCQALSRFPARRNVPGGPKEPPAVTDHSSYCISQKCARPWRPDGPSTGPQDRDADGLQTRPGHTDHCSCRVATQLPFRRSNQNVQRTFGPTIPPACSSDTSASALEPSTSSRLNP